MDRLSNGPLLCCLCLQFPLSCWESAERHQRIFLEKQEIYNHLPNVFFRAKNLYLFSLVQRKSTSKFEKLSLNFSKCDKLNVNYHLWSDRVWRASKNTFVTGVICSIWCFWILFHEGWKKQKKRISFTIMSHHFLHVSTCCVSTQISIHHLLH